MGLGAIGQTIARRLSGFDVGQLVYTDLQTGVKLRISFSIGARLASAVTEKTRYNMAEIAATNIINAIAGRPMISPVPKIDFYFFKL